MKSITELWTPVLLNDGIFKDDYIVSNMGRVKHKRYFKDGGYQYVLVHVINSRRPVVKMTGGGRQYRKSVAKLVLSSFHWRDGCECANITYLDGDMKNCRLSNLRYTADKNVYAKVEEDNAVLTVPKAAKSAVIKSAKTVKQPFVRSCESCCKNPCFSGMENLSSDFGAEGCRKYKPREDLSNNSNN